MIIKDDQKMSRRKQLKPIRLQEGEEGENVENIRPLDESELNGDAGRQRLEDESFDDDEGSSVSAEDGMLSASSPTHRTSAAGGGESAAPGGLSVRRFLSQHPEDSLQKMDDDLDDNITDQDDHREDNNVGDEENRIKDQLLKMNIGGLLQQQQQQQQDVLKLEPKEQLKALEDTIMQLSSSLMKLGKPESIQDVSLLQATLVSLQQTQLLQFHLLNRINKEADNGETLMETADKYSVKNPFLAQLTAAANAANNDSIADDKRPLDLIQQHQPAFDVKRERELFPLPSNISNNSGGSTSPLLGNNNHFNYSRNDENKPVTSSALASLQQSASAILSPDSIQGPGEGGLNSLELLTQKAQGILNNASRGVLSSNMTDMSRAGGGAINSSGSNGSASGESIKHRCKYCGKVFGSDSALSIHIRSHTGERPYKCNVCGNRFTTKGNLKVHFQRHSDRFPIVKMNPNMVPEHVDKFYPSLLQQCEEAEKKGLPLPEINNPVAGMNPVVPPGTTMPNLPGMPPPVTSIPHSPSNRLHHPFPGMHSLTGPKIPLTPGALPRYPLPTEPLRREEVLMTEKPAWLRNLPIFPGPVAYPPSVDLIKKNMRDELKLDMNPYKVSAESVSPSSSVDMKSDHRESSDPRESSDHRGSSPMSDTKDISIQDEPENLSSYNNRKHESKSPIVRDTSLDKFKIGGAGFPLLGMHQFPFLQNPLLRPPGNPFLAGLPKPGFQPTITPANMFSPAREDNSWENLIEVDKSNEDSIVESMIDDKDKLTEPNECKICHRILSCKSALQMHYRTHTGERPFKCKLCKRTFTTKGNLKTHMSVHRTKPPMRNFPQCPVCHKRYSNPAILQQHVRSHTGEKADLTPEQIEAAEVKDFYPSPAGFSPEALNKFFPGFMASQMAGYDDDIGDERGSRPSSVSSSTSGGSNLNSLSPFPAYSPFSASIAALEKQVKTMDGQERTGREDCLSRQERPVSREQSPEPSNTTTRHEEPQDLSKPSSDDKKSESESIYDHNQGSDIEDKDDEDDQQRGHSVSPPASSLGAASTPPLFSQGQFMLPGADPTNPLLAATAVSGVHGLPRLPLPGQLFPSLGFPNPLAHLAAAAGPGGIHPPPAAFQHFGLPMHPMGSMDEMFIGRGRTTCQLCMKVFACNSALEIHMRSHTKERPFKCDVCGKGFTTKGNMKQHSMTHKFRDNETAAAYNKLSPPHVSSSSLHATTAGLHVTTAGLHVTTASLSSGLSNKSPGSSPMTSPPSSQCVSPPTFSSSGGVKRPQEDLGVSMVDSRPPEKRAILCG